MTFPHSSARRAIVLALVVVVAVPTALIACDSPSSLRGPRRSTPSGTRAHPFYESPEVELIPVEEARAMREGRGPAASVPYEVAEPATDVAASYGIEEEWPEAGTSVEMDLEPSASYASDPMPEPYEIVAEPVVDPGAGTYAPPTFAEPTVAARGEDSLTPLGPGAARLTPVARIEHPAIRENSGLAYLADSYWTVNDSGDGPYVYRSDVPWFASAEQITVPGATAVDWEELAVWGEDLLICDVGDNLRERGNATLYRVRPTATGVDLVATYPIAYPDGPHDAEAVVVIGDVVNVIVKNRGEEGSPVFAFANLIDGADLPTGERNMGEHVGTLATGLHEQVTAADVHADGVVAVLSYSELLLYPGDRLDGDPMGGFALHARQNEALTFVGDSIVMTNEQRDVYIVDELLWVGEYWWLPPRTSATLKQVPMTKEALEAKMPPMELLAELPLQNLKSGEFLRFGVSADQFFFDGRFYLEDGFFPSSASGPLGTSLMIVLGEEQRLRVTSNDFQVALTGTETGKIRPRRIDLDGGTPRGGLAGFRYGGSTSPEVFRFTLAIDVDEVFPDGLPEVFLLNLAGNGFRRPGGNEPVLSGFDAYSLYRPFMWAAIHRD